MNCMACPCDFEMNGITLQGNEESSGRRIVTLRRNDTLYWTTIDIPPWKLLVAATNEGLAYVNNEQEPYDDFVKWAARYFPGSEVLRDEQRVGPYVKQLLEYWRGERRKFDLPKVLRGTEFQRDVWNALLNIGYGETCSYAHIANIIGRPKAIRAVGGAAGQNPLLIVIPCHRVIGKSGSLTGFSSGLDLKKYLLQLEGHAIRNGYVQLV